MFWASPIVIVIISWSKKPVRYALTILSISCGGGWNNCCFFMLKLAECQSGDYCHKTGSVKFVFSAILCIENSIVIVNYWWWNFSHQLISLSILMFQLLHIWGLVGNNYCCCTALRIGHVNVQSCFSLLSNINQSACSILDWLFNKQSDFDRVLYMHHWEFPIQ